MTQKWLDLIREAERAGDAIRLAGLTADDRVWEFARDAADEILNAVIQFRLRVAELERGGVVVN
jgi:hypothetical protein